MTQSEGTVPCPDPDTPPSGAGASAGACPGPATSGSATPTPGASGPAPEWISYPAAILATGRSLDTLTRLSRLGHLRRSYIPEGGWCFRHGDLIPYILPPGEWVNGKQALRILGTTSHHAVQKLVIRGEVRCHDPRHLPPLYHRGDLERTAGERTPAPSQSRPRAS